jgi:hypothetical protein
MLDWLELLAEAFAGAVLKFTGLDITPFLNDVLDFLGGLGV